MASQVREQSNGPGSVVADCGNGARRFSGVGMVRLIQGDALAILPTLAAGSVDVALTDPPYSSGGMFRGDRLQSTRSKYVMSDTILSRPEFDGDNRDQRGWAFWAALWLSELRRVVVPGGLLFSFVDWRQLPTATDVLQAAGWVWRGIIPWNKTEAVRPQRGRFRAQCEYILIGSNGPWLEQADRCLPGFFTYGINAAEKRHTTGKPVALLRDLLQVTRPGAVVLDPFMGSGSCGVACVQTGRSFIGIECNPAYFAVAQDWLRETEAQPRLALAEPVPQPGLGLAA